MPQNTELDLAYEHYKNWDMSNSKPARLNPMIAKLQENARLATLQQNNLLDEDVADWLVKQNSKTRSHINELLRQIMGMRPINLA